MFDWMRNWWQSRKAAAMFESAVEVEDANGTLKVIYPDGTIQSIQWDDLDQIEIHTNDSGPWGADVWWVLSGKYSQCEYPQGATGDSELFKKYQTLEGFNNEEFIMAMGSTSNRRFICWVNPNATKPEC